MNKMKLNIKELQFNMERLVDITKKLVDYQGCKAGIDTDSRQTYLSKLLSNSNNESASLLVSLSESMDVLLDQMLRTQEKLTDANVITISKQLTNDDVVVSVSGDQIRLKFKVEPTKSGNLTLKINDNVDLMLFIGYNNKVVHSDNSNYICVFDTDDASSDILIKPCGNSAGSINHASITNINLIHDYEFEQDEFMTFCVSYLSNKDPQFFNSLISNVHQYSSSK